MNKHLFSYKWNLSDGYPAPNIEHHKLKVFGTFICGGGSSMGYKLAGFEHLGGVEIDPEVADVYKTNHNPKYLYNMDIRDFNNLENLPTELYNLDILDGSPPCSTFSMAGSREDAWGKQKQFREGQAVQTLDDLVFVYCDTILKLKPKVFLLENVKGIIQGNAKVYSKNIVEKMTKGGYNVQVFCLNAASMGVPQKRERVFFIGYKKELNFHKLKLDFNERPILFGEIKKNNPIGFYEEIIPSCSDLWIKCKQGMGLDSVHENRSSFFSKRKMADLKVSNTLTANCSKDFLHSTQKRCLNVQEFQLIGTYPLDYNFKKIDAGYLIGMSVPPVMTAQIANQIYLQWFKTAQ